MGARRGGLRKVGTNGVEGWGAIHGVGVIGEGTREVEVAGEGIREGETGVEMVGNGKRILGVEVIEEEIREGARRIGRTPS